MTETNAGEKADWQGGLCRWHGWVPLGIAVAVIVVGVFLLSQEPEPKCTPGPGARLISEPDIAPMIQPLTPSAVTDGPALHSIRLTEEMGQPVYCIRAVPNGDELIIDAVTGKLLSVREASGRAPKPAREPPRAKAS
jgi:hypothetical protein